MTQYEIIEISDEEIRKQLDEREGGRKAGRGDSPYSQEFYEDLYGLKKKKKKRQMTHHKGGSCISGCANRKYPLFPITLSWGNSS